VVYTLQNTVGVVQLAPASEVNELLVTFNASRVTVEEIIGTLEAGGDQVTGWEIME
jgi:hypothetical protein